MKLPRRVRAAAVALAAAVAVAWYAAAAGNETQPGAASPGTCLPGPPSPAVIAAPATGSALPDLVLSCLDGSGTVPFGQLKGPAVVNLWASWCGPCRTELPTFQRYAVSQAGQVSVLGVDTRDTRDAALSMVEDFGLTYPMLHDDRGALLAALGGRPLPVTVFVDQAGRIAHVYNGSALDDAGLTALARRHLGLAGRA